MKTLACKDLGVAKCDFVAKGETDKDVKKAMYEHAGKSHRDMMDKMTDDQKKELDKKMDDMLAKQK